MCSKSICLSVRDSVCGWVRTNLREGYGVKECLWEWMVIFLSACVQGILWFFTNFYLQRKFWIFLRNDPDCKTIYTDRYTKVSEQLSSTGSTARRNSKDWLAGQPIHISYKMTEERQFTPSGLTKKNSRMRILQETQFGQWVIYL